MLAGVSAFVPLDWSRVGLWVVALAFGALAFGALGVAIGALAREVRAASLLAFLLSLPLAFLALVPGGSVAGGAVRRDHGRVVRVPVQGHAPGARRGRQRRVSVDRLLAVHLTVLALVFAALARVGAAARRVSARRAPARGRREGSNLERAMAFPQTRMRRLRASAGLARARARDRAERGPAHAAAVRRRCELCRPAREPIAAMPGVERLSISAAVAEAREAAGAGHRRGDAVRRSLREGRAGLGRMGRGGRRAGGDAGDQAGAARAARGHRRVPVRVHLARTLRRAADGRRDAGRRQRRHRRAARHARR